MAQLSEDTLATLKDLVEKSGDDAVVCILPGHTDASKFNHTFIRVQPEKLEHIVKGTKHIINIDTSKK